MSGHSCRLPAALGCDEWVLEKARTNAELDAALAKFASEEAAA